MNGRVLLAAGVAVAAGYRFAFRPWQRRWGATAEEAFRPLPGDELVPAPKFETTRAITVDAEPRDVWPWLAQMGYDRGGLYSYDWLDIFFGVLDEPSNKEVLPEFQHLAAGDVIPVRNGPPFPVAMVEKERVLVLAGGEEQFRWTWQTVLEPLDSGRTRLITRNRATIAPGWRARLLLAWLDPAAFVMVRRWLVVLKGRGEMLAARRRAREDPAREAVAGRPG